VEFNRDVERGMPIDDVLAPCRSVLENFTVVIVLFGKMSSAISVLVWKLVIVTLKIDDEFENAELVRLNVISEPGNKLSLDAIELRTENGLELPKDPVLLGSVILVALVSVLMRRLVSLLQEGHGMLEVKIASELGVGSSFELSIGDVKLEFCSPVVILIAPVTLDERSGDDSFELNELSAALGVSAVVRSVKLEFERVAVFVDIVIFSAPVSAPVRRLVVLAQVGHGTHNVNVEPELMMVLGFKLSVFNEK
jgi:hypothetical protein